MCAQLEEPAPVQAKPGRYTSSTTRRWAIILQWIPRPSLPTFQNPCHARLKGDAKVRSGSARRGPGAVRWMYPVRAAQRARQPSCQTVEHAMPAMHTTRAVHLSMCCPPFRRRDMISLFPLLDQEIFSSLLLVFHFPFSLLLRQTRTEALHSSLRSPSSALSLLDALFFHPPHRSLSLPSSLFFLSYFFFLYWSCITPAKLPTNEDGHETFNIVSTSSSPCLLLALAYPPEHDLGGPLEHEHPSRSHSTQPYSRGAGPHRENIV